MCLHINSLTRRTIKHDCFQCNTKRKTVRVRTKIDLYPNRSENENQQFVSYVLLVYNKTNASHSGLTYQLLMHFLTFLNNVSVEYRISTHQ